MCLRFPYLMIILPAVLSCHHEEIKGDKEVGGDEGGGWKVVISVIK